MAKQVATRQETLPAANDYAEFAGQGFENLTREDFTIPFLTLLQGLSPQIQTVDGAKIGMLINTVTDELYSGQEGVPFVPVTTRHVYNEWRPNRGGKAGEHDPASPEVATAKANCDFGKLKLPNGNDLTETFYVYGGTAIDGIFSPAVISFKSKSIRPYRNWMGKITAVRPRFNNPPMWAFRFRLRSFEDTQSGQKFANWNIAWDGANADAALVAVLDPIFRAATELYKAVSENRVKTADENVSGQDHGDDASM